MNFLELVILIFILEINVCCCFSKDNCDFPDYIGDNICDDGNNNMHCNWDGGDCCIDNVNTTFCNHCDCLDEDVKLCSVFNLCGLDEGDCNDDSECKPGLICGEDNCPSELGLDSSIDCCYKCNNCFRSM